MKITCSPDKIKHLLSVTECLMRKANIAIRDTWDGYDGKNYDNGHTNGGNPEGPKIFDVQLVRNGVTRVTLYPAYIISGFNSLAYENITLFIPVRRAKDLDVVIHEIVHFLQHTTESSNQAYFEMKSPTPEDYRAFVDQRVEQEAHFVQLLYINEFVKEKIEEQYLLELIKLLQIGLSNPSDRTDIIVFAKSIGVI